MPEPASNESPSAGANPAPAEPARSTPPKPAPVGPIKAGTTWAGDYAIDEMIDFSSQTGRRLWAGRTRAEHTPVVLVEFPAPDRAAREQVWPLLTEHEVRHLQRPREVRGDRVEIYDLPPGVPILTWREGVEQVELEFLATAVRQLGAAIHALHTRGLAHLSIQPENLHLDTSGPVPQFHLRGLESLVLIERAEPVGLSPNPYYAPPEAIGIYKHAPGRELRMWDWWSLGRTLQTLFLGQPVLGAVLKRDIRRLLKEFSIQAAELTKERLSGVVRAGAIESLGEIDPHFILLFQGLLTNSCDGRWGWEQLERWIAGESPAHYYNLARNTRLFMWEDQGYTIADAATLLSTKENWEVGIHQIFAREEKHSLIAYVNSVHGDKDLAQQVNGLAQLIESSTFAEYPRSLVCEVIGAISLMELANGPFHWRGERLSADGLRHQLGTREGAERFNSLHLLTRPKVVQQIRAHDTAAERLLSNLAKTAEEAEHLIRLHQWFDLEDEDTRAQLWSEALGPEERHAKPIEGLRIRYGSSSIPALNEIFQKKDPSPAEAVILALTAQDPVRFGYITHLDEARARHRALQEEGAKVYEALFWRSLGGAATTGFWIFARWPVWVATLTIFALAGLAAKPGPTWAALALAPVAAAVLARLLMQNAIGDLLKKAIPTADRWSWWDGPARCRREARALRPERLPLRLANRLRAINHELGKLKILKPPPELFAFPPRPTSVWAMAVVSWVMLGSLSAFYGWSLYQHPPSWPAIKFAWTHPGAGSEGLAAQARPVEVDLSILKLALPEGYDPNDPAFAANETGEPLTEEGRYALARGRELAAEFTTEDDTDPIAVFIPGEDVRLMIYDPKTDRLLHETIFPLSYEPRTPSALSLDGVVIRYYGR